MGQDRYDLHETTARIVGYCVQSGNRVLELMADPEFPGLEREIIARVCAEVLEAHRVEPLRSVEQAIEARENSSANCVAIQTGRPPAPIPQHDVAAFAADVAANCGEGN